MKKSGSCFLKTKSNFNTLYFGNSDSSNAYTQSTEKESILKFELERCRDSIMRLRTELYDKMKEISMLKVHINKKDDEHQKILRVIEEILKQCDQSTATGFRAIEENLNTSFIPKDENSKNNEQCLGEMLHFNETQKKSLNELLFINGLKNQIYSLNEELEKKDKELNQLKKNKNSTNYIRLQNSYAKNFNELTQVKKQNEIIKTKMDDANNMLMSKKENNINLKNKLQKFQGKFKDYKEVTIKKTESLENKLKIAKERERECRIFHIQKITKNYKTPSNNLNNRNYVNNSTSDRDSTINVNNINISKLNEAETQLKQKSHELNTLKKEINNKNSDIKKLNKEKNNLNNQIKNLNNENNKILSQINNINKQIEELNNKNSDKEKENNELKSKIEECEEKYNEEHQNYLNNMENLKNKNKEIEELKKQIEELKNNNNKDEFFFTGIGAIGTRKGENNDDEKNDLNELSKIENKLDVSNKENIGQEGDISLNKLIEKSDND